MQFCARLVLNPGSSLMLQGREVAALLQSHNSIRGPCTFKNLNLVLVQKIMRVVMGTGSPGSSTGLKRFFNEPKSSSKQRATPRPVFGRNTQTSPRATAAAAPARCFLPLPPHTPAPLLPQIIQHMATLFLRASSRISIHPLPRLIIHTT